MTKRIVSLTEEEPTIRHSKSVLFTPVALPLSGVAQELVFAILMKRNTFPTDVFEQPRNLNDVVRMIESLKFGWKSSKLDSDSILHEALKMQRQKDHKNSMMGQEFTIPDFREALTCLFKIYVMFGFMDMNTNDMTPTWCNEYDVPQLSEKKHLGLTSAELQSSNGPLNIIKLTSGLNEEINLQLIGWGEREINAQLTVKFRITPEHVVDWAELIASKGILFGASCGMLRRCLIYSTLFNNPMLSDGKPLFHKDHKNLLTGKKIQFSLPVAANAIATMANASGMQKNERMNVLLLHNENYDMDKAKYGETAYWLLGGHYAFFDSYMPFRRWLYHPKLMEKFTSSPDAWFLIADPKGKAPFEVSYLFGTNRLPQIREIETTPDKPGISWEIVMEMGVKVADYHGLFKADSE